VRAERRSPSKIGGNVAHVPGFEPYAHARFLGERGPVAAREVVHLELDVVRVPLDVAFHTEGDAQGIEPDPRARVDLDPAHVQTIGALERRHAASRAATSSAVR
jgi:hypothetical protein